MNGVTHGGFRLMRVTRDGDYVEGIKLICLDAMKWKLVFCVAFTCSCHALSFLLVYFFFLRTVFLLPLLTY